MPKFGKPMLRHPVAIHTHDNAVRGRYRHNQYHKECEIEEETANEPIVMGIRYLTVLVLIQSITRIDNANHAREQAGEWRQQACNVDKPH
ncbi:Uncharacterised protein [Vibrio cholerae]|nr:Uncharacterised protein [Vibrio cholerae]CRZ74137.1 Uncharacterised protein [Vibrio cholerae]CSA11191.1 Uncharacterised protein [Vibrio cholerae]CSA70014.1 Uncharacterised protein [Vibrio cholerae]CSB45091.1 Uncharacterised protein [Vibrio cholerae]